MAGGTCLILPGTSTTEGMHGNKHNVREIRFAEVKEPRCGFLVLKVPDLGQALEWAARWHRPFGRRAR